MTIEILNDFIHQELSYHEDVWVESYEVYQNGLHLIFTNKSNSVFGFGEVISLERYQNWLSRKRDIKVNQLI